ncbi:SH3 domain-containing protein [Salegentibacter holothuriorum]|uniref:SH3 domain-containing protein n=1 Tax=Salegentibacter holothuriorum TaxID=241145 RepID=A0A1T5BS53_9FLAO|nr:tetratricopeptide repeat protein [Salegentibacter holothuriorum]SKB50007.1 SH3 domain-containing protein [Salegentibacter holothuriorum]
MKNLIFILLVFVSTLAQAQNSELFEEANDAYANNDFETAINKYEKILENGETSVAVYYNLGNAHYKLNNVAPSIYYFEKALQLDPTDEDVQNNIEFARSMTIDDIPVNEETGLQKSINSFISTFSYNTWAYLAIALSIVFVVLFLLYYFGRTSLQKRIFFGVAIFVFLLGGISVFFAFQQQEIQFNNQFAIIFAEEAPIKNEPSQKGDATFSLHAGTKAKVLEDYQGWVKIELSNGTQGWIEDNYLRRL